MTAESLRALNSVRRDAEKQPFEGFLGFGRHIGAHAAHEEVLGPQTDIGFVGLELLEPMAFEDMDQHIAVLQCGQAGAVQVPGPGVADHVNDHFLKPGVAQHHVHEIVGNLGFAPCAADLDDFNLHHHPAPQPGPAFVRVRIAQYPEADDMAVRRQGQGYVGPRDGGVGLQGFQFGNDRFVPGIGAELLIETIAANLGRRAESADANRPLDGGTLDGLWARARQGIRLCPR